MDTTRWLLAMLAVSTLTACESHPWTGFVYPDRANLLDHRELGAFRTLDDCRASANLYLRDIAATESGTYECGRNCRRRDGLTVLVCDETTT